MRRVETMLQRMGTIRVGLALLFVAACARSPAPILDPGADALPGLIEVELRGRAAVPGKVIDA